MISFHPQVRRAVTKDHRRIASLIFQESNTHRHLDWRNALEWIGAQNFWVLEDRGWITAALACPEDPPDVAWIRLFSYDAHLSGPEAWRALWEVARADIFDSNPRSQTASIVMKQWFQSLLLSGGFEPRLNIVLLELDLKVHHAPHDAPRVRIRPMRDSDMNDVTQVDREAFGAFWHNTIDSLQRARRQAVYASVAEDESGVIGYQISTGNPSGAHLARLAVRPEAQGRGVGSALVQDLIAYSRRSGLSRLSVNTQEDNHSSLRLYRKFGFARTGEYYPVLVHSMETSS